MANNKLIKIALLGTISFILILYISFREKIKYDYTDPIYQIPISEIGELDKEKILYIYNWVDYMPPSVIHAFEKITDVKVILDVFDSNETLEVKLLAGNSGYDLVVPSASPYFTRQLQANVYQKLDKNRLFFLKNIDDFFLNNLSIIDKNNEHAVPYLWGISGFAINMKRVKEANLNIPLDSWALLFDKDTLQKIAPLRVEISDSPSELFPAVIRYMNIDKKDINSKEALEKAFKLLQNIRPLIFKFNASAVQDLFNHTACVAMGTSGDIRKILISAKKNGEKLDIQFIAPKEGSALWIDVCAIPKNARHVKNAHAFINFLLHPRVIAKITNHTGCANAVPLSKQYITPEILNDKMVYPSDEQIEKSYTESALPAPLERLRTRMFTKIKSEAQP